MNDTFWSFLIRFLIRSQELTQRSLLDLANRRATNDPRES